MLSWNRRAVLYSFQMLQVVNNKVIVLLVFEPGVDLS